MSESIPIIFPEDGLNEAEAFSDQPPKTTREGRNVRLQNRKNGRRCGGQRSGSKLWLAGTANGANKISRIESVIYARKKMTYAALADGSHSVLGQVPTPALADCPGVCVDDQSNVFALDGAAGVVKFNSELTQVFKLAVPTVDPLHVCRALWVDDFGGIFVAVSAGGDFDKARIWKFRQDDDNKTSKLFEIETHAFVERIVRVDGLLYTLQNNPETQQTWVVTYSRIDGQAPEEEWRTEVSYPGNDLCVSPLDGSVFWSSEPTATRGFNPKSPHTSVKLTDWRPDLLYKFKQRCWHWYDLTDFDSLTLRYPTNSEDPDGAEILRIGDKSGYGRDLLSDAKTGLGGTTADTGPQYRLQGIGGLPCAHFSGVATTGTTGVAGDTSVGQSMYTIAPSSTDRAYREYQRSMFPTYDGAQFVWCCVIRAPIEAIESCLVHLPHTARPKALYMNRGSGAAGATAAIRPGTVALYDLNGTASDAASSAVAAGGPSGANGGAANPLPAIGSRGPYGHAIITWVNDGGVHDVFGTASRSTLRINGQPVDRWQNEKAWNSLLVQALGYPNGATAGQTAVVTMRRFAGEIGESICLCDWEDSDSVTQRLVSTGSASPPTGAQSSYPDANPSSNLDGDVERLEGYLAHKWGLSHLLPGARTALLSLVNANANVADTVTIDGTVYTFRAALGAANDVLIGATANDTLLNLSNAMNHTGVPGTDYYYSTTAHPTYFAMPPQEVNATTTRALRIESRNPNAAADNVAESTATVRFSWSSATTIFNENGAGGNIGNYPHAYYLVHNTQVAGGPPVEGAAPGNSKMQDLASKYGILGKLDAGGKLRWAATSNYQNNGLGLGGVGYGCVCNSAGEIYSVGPRQALVTEPAILADAFDYRKFVDTGDAFRFSGGGTALTDPWWAAGAENLYHYPRLAIDKFDNVYIPILDAAETVSLRVFQRQPSAAATGLGVQIASVTNITDDPQGYAVITDPRVPEYETDLSDTSNPIVARAQNVFLATRKEPGSTTNVVHKIGLVSSTPAGGSPRARVDLVASGTALKSFTAGGAFVAISTPFDAAADFIDSITIFEKAVFVDGINTFVYDPKKNTVTRLKAKGPGQVPQGCALISDFNGRIMLARDKSNPHRWYAGEQGNIQGWDFKPPTPTFTSAVAHTDPRIGPVPDIINAMCKASEDKFLFGCQKSIWMLLGDPAASNAQLRVVSGSDCGMAFGRSTARDGEGNLFFVGARGGFYQWTDGPKCLSDETIPRRMRDLDLGSNWVELVWDPRENAMKVYLCPFGAGGSQRLAYTWERRTGKIIPWEDSYGTATDFSRQPTCAKLIEGDTATERVLLYGTEDGHILAYDEATQSDDTMPIDAFVLIHVSPKLPGKRLMFRRLKLALAQDDGGCNFEFFASSIAEQLGQPHMAGLLRPGPNPTKPVRVRGRNAWVRLRSAMVGSGFAFEEGTVDVEVVSKDRAAR